jgi:hypothetical protein
LHINRDRKLSALYEIETIDDIYHVGISQIYYNSPTPDLSTLEPSDPTHIINSHE